MPELETGADYSTGNNPHKSNRSFTRAWHAAKNSWSGLEFAVRVLVLIVELVNSGVEAAIDRISFEHRGC